MQYIDLYVSAKPCIYFQSSSCPLSEDECDYAHVLAAPDQCELLKSPQSTLRTKPCRYYLASTCKDGYWCRFKHPASVVPGNSAVPESMMQGEKAMAVYEDDVDVRSLKGAWRAKPDQHPKYRSKRSSFLIEFWSNERLTCAPARPCRNFLLGKCIYGDRCSYLHVAASPTSSMCGASSASSTLSSPMAVSTFPLTAPSTPPYPPHLILTPPPTRVPNCTPVPELELDGPIELAAGLLEHYEEKIPKTPSNTSSQPVDWPPTPGSLPSSADEGHVGNEVYCVDRPLTPLTPPSANGQNILEHDKDSVDAQGTPLQAPPTPPYTVYSPASVMAVSVLPAPVPLYQNTPASAFDTAPQPHALLPPTIRQRALSQPNIDLGKPSDTGRNPLFFRSKYDSSP